MTKWSVSIASDPDGEGAEQIFDNVNDAKAYVFDLISSENGASTIYTKCKFYEEFKVTTPFKRYHSYPKTFYIYVFGFPV